MKTRLVQDYLTTLLTIFLATHGATCLWIRANNIQDNDLFNTYLDALYFFIVTATSVGYGDQVVDPRAAVHSSTLHLYAILVISYGLFYFALVLHLNTFFLHAWHVHSLRKGKDKDGLDDWFAALHLQSGLTITWKFECKVKRNYLAQVNKDIISKLSYGRYYDKLPYDWQALVQYYIAYDLISAFEILKAVPESVAVQVALKYSYLQ